MGVCLVTGGAGFIGSHLVEELLKRGNAVVVIDNLYAGSKENLKKALKHPKCRFYEVDIESKEKIQALFREYKPDTVFHLAAQQDVRVSIKNPVLDAQINLVGSLTLLEACKKYGSHFIFSSSGGAIYADDLGEAATEESRVNPKSPYGVAKLSLEYYLKCYQQFGVTTTMLRYANVYGPRQKSDNEGGVVSIFANLLTQGKVPTIFGTGKQTRDFVYVKDVVSANCFAMEETLQGIYNVGTGTEISILDLYKTLAKLVGKKSKPQHTPPIVGEAQRSCVSAEKLEQAGWSRKYDLEKGLQETLDALSMKVKR